MIMAKIFKTGNSLAVTVPSRFVRAVGLRSGDTVHVVSQIDRGRLTFQFSGARQLSLSDARSSKRKKVLRIK